MGKVWSMRPSHVRDLPVGLLVEAMARDTDSVCGAVVDQAIAGDKVALQLIEEELIEALVRAGYRWQHPPTGMLQFGGAGDTEPRR